MYKNTLNYVNLNPSAFVKLGKKPKKEDCRIIKFPHFKLNLKWRFKLEEIPSQSN
jgi:hypothetical protein